MSSGSQFSTSFTLPYNSIVNGISNLRIISSHAPSLNQPISDPCIMPSNRFYIQDYKINLSKPKIIFVDDNATGTNDGLSWENAFTNIKLAITKVNDDDMVEMVYVKEGIYRPSDTNRHLRTTILGRPVSYFGGFPDAIVNPSLLDRDPHVYLSNFDGNIGDPNSIADNIKTQFVFSGATTDSNKNFVLDGFYFTNNIAFANLIQNTQVNPLNVTFYNCVFSENKHSSGSAMYASNFNTNYGQTKIIYDRCKFIDNGNTITKGSGGALYSVGNAKVIVTNSLFEGNQARHGGAIMIRYSNQTANLINNTFVNNQAKYGGAVAALHNANIDITNSVLWNNQSSSSASFVDIYASDSQINIYNSLLENAQCSSNNISCHNIIGNVDPIFVDSSQNNFKLDSSSPAIDYGIDNGIIVEDIDGNIRPIGNGIDLGCYEHNSSTQRFASFKENLSIKSSKLTSSIFPNPTDGVLYVYYPNKYELGQIQVYNTNGNIVKSFKIQKKSEKIRIDLSNLASGLYFINGLFDDNQMSWKVVKE